MLCLDVLDETNAFLRVGGWLVSIGLWGLLIEPSTTHAFNALPRPCRPAIPSLRAAASRACPYLCGHRCEVERSCEEVLATGEGAAVRCIAAG